MIIEDYPYLIIGEDEQELLDDLEPGAVVVDAEHDVCTLRYDHNFHENRWFAAGSNVSYAAPTLPAIVLVQEFGPDDYPEEWYDIGGEAVS